MPQNVTLQLSTAIARLPLVEMTQVLFLQLRLQKLLLLPFDRSKKYCLQPEILTIKDSANSGPPLSKGQHLWECLLWPGGDLDDPNVIIGHVQEIVLGF